MIKKLKIGTRDSKLALVQSYWVRDTLQAYYPDLVVEIIEVKTQGDKILDVALSKIGDKGLFTKELEHELLKGNIDLAVHSMKDLPTQLPDGLEIIATTEREDARDVVCFAKRACGISSLSEAKVIASSSLRRVAQLKQLYPDKEFVDIRGNLQTRFKKLDDPASGIDAMILAAAGLHRLEMQSRIDQYLDPQEILPAVGQGALAIEIATKRDEIKEFLRKALNSSVDELVIKAERAFLRELEGGCQVPIGVYSVTQSVAGSSEQALNLEGASRTFKSGSLGHSFAAPQDDRIIELKGIVISLNGQEQVRDLIKGKLVDAEKLGKELAKRLKQKGALNILKNIRIEA